MSIENNNIPDNPSIVVLKAGQSGVFTNYIYKAIPLAFDESMSYYETLLGLLNYLENVIIPTVNNNADAVAELQNLYVELKDYVEHYFDNLDVQEEINNKLDEMVEDGVLEQIIEQYIQSSALWCFNSVTEMKAATNLIDGSYAKTTGYYSANDGGEGTYIIVDDDNLVDDGGLVHELSNGLFAKLINNKTINAKQFGAYGDNIHDDTTAIQKCLLLLNDYKVIIPKGTYITSLPLNLTDKAYREINLIANESIIKYSGNEYAFIMKSITYGTLDFGVIESENGGCIKFYSQQSADSSAYITLNFINLKASSNCIYATRTDGWINEFIVNGGKLTTGNWGVNLEINSPDEGNMNGWKFYNVCVEGVSNGFKFNAVSGSISNIAILNPRYAEIDTYTYLIQTIGKCTNIRFTGNTIFYMYKSTFSSDTTFMEIESPTVYKNFPVFYTGGIIKKGEFIPTEANYPQLNNYIKTIVDGDDLNDFVYPGTYTSYSVSSGSSVDHLPTGGYSYLGFRLFVVSMSDAISTYDSHKNINQILINGSDRMFMRNGHWESSSYSFGEWREITNHRAGATSGRPSSCGVGYLYFDTTLGKPVWYNGSGWVDATGTSA